MTSQQHVLQLHLHKVTQPRARYLADWKTRNLQSCYTSWCMCRGILCRVSTHLYPAWWMRDVFTFLQKEIKEKPLEQFYFTVQKPTFIPA